jgi:hypothetical protein
MDELNLNNHAMVELLIQMHTKIKNIRKVITQQHLAPAAARICAEDYLTRKYSDQVFTRFTFDKWEVEMS